MFCSQCGMQVEGRFCSNCGTALKAGSYQGAHPPDWSQETRYHVLLRQPEVRALIARHASLAKRPMTMEEFLAGFTEGAVSAVELGFVGSSIMTLTTGFIYKVVRRLTVGLGFKTGKTHAEFIQTPPAYAMVAVLCSLAQRGRPLQGVVQMDDGCLFEGFLPSTIGSPEGSLLISVRRKDEGAFVEATTEIRGQLVDWGKSCRCLDELFTDLHSIPLTFAPPAYN